MKVGETFKNSYGSRKVGKLKKAEKNGFDWKSTSFLKNFSVISIFIFKKHEKLFIKKFIFI